MKNVLKQFLALTVLSALIPVAVFGQSTDKLSDQFANSYAYERVKDYAKAIDALKGADDSKSYEVNIRLGWLNYLAKSYADSLSYYQKAASLKPSSLEALFAGLNPALAMKDQGKVIDLYQKILKIDPQNTGINYQLGLIYYEKKDYASARQHFEKVISLYPLDYNSLNMLAWTALRLNSSDAGALFRKILLIVPNDISALKGLSEIK